MYRKNLHIGYNFKIKNLLVVKGPFINNMRVPSGEVKKNLNMTLSGGKGGKSYYNIIFYHWLRLVKHFVRFDFFF